MPVGTIAWSAPIEALSQVGDLNAAMGADADLTALVAKGADFVAETDDDRLLAIVAGEITGNSAVGSYVGAVRAMAAPGKWSAAGAWAAHIAGVYTEVTGLNVVVTSTVAGPMGEIAWWVRTRTRRVLKRQSVPPWARRDTSLRSTAPASSSCRAQPRHTPSASRETG